MDHDPTSYGNSRYCEIDRETTADLRDRITALETALREAREEVARLRNFERIVRELLETAGIEVPPTAGTEE